MTSRIQSNGNGKASMAAAGLAGPLPPQNLEAERAVLGGLLMAPERFAEVFEIVGPGDFYRDAHVTMFQAMVDLHRQGKPIDIVTLADDLSHRDRAQFSGGRGAEFLEEITNAVPHGVNTVYHAEIVRALACNRQVIEAGQEMIRDAHSHQFTPEKLRDRSAKRLADIKPANKSKTLARVKMRHAADIVEKKTTYLWYPRIQMGALVSLAGDPKLGKSLVSLWLAARVSKGELGDEPGSVIIMSAEDNPEKTIVKRLRVAGADMTKVHILDSVFLADGNEALPSLKADIQALEEAAVGLSDCKMMDIDPVSAYLGGVDDHNNAQLRGILTPLSKMAERRDFAVSLISHLTKTSGTNGKYRVTGSIAYVGACRSNFLFVRDRNDPTGRRVLMLDNGCNEGAPIPTLAYTVQDDGQGPYVKWEDEPVDITAEEALAAETEARRPAHRPPGEILKAIEFLKKKLESGDEKACELIDDWLDKGGSKGTIFCAKNAMEEEGTLVVDDTKKPKIWHLVQSSGPESSGLSPDTQEPAF